MENKILKCLQNEIIVLEYLIKRLDKNNDIIKNISQNIIEKLDILDFDTFKDQSDEAIQALYDFNMIHEEFNLNIVNENRYNYWQRVDGLSCAYKKD